ncbi:MAG: PQQ-binding-like beta-propeller repeat protein [Pirellula sp.]
MLKRLRLLTLGLFVAFGSISTTQTNCLGDDWPTFRGPNRTSVVNDPKLLKSWPEGGPKLVWEASGAGLGYSSLAIVGDKIFTLGSGLSAQENSDESLKCFDRATGKQLWSTPTGAAWKDRQPNWESSRSTPTVDGNRVYVVTPYGSLVCCQVSDGKEVWKKHLEKDLGGKKADSWGYSESVLIDGNKLICTPGGAAATVVALDKATGETIWTCKNPEDRGAGHASVSISRVGGTKVYVQSTGSGLMGFSEKGELFWTYPIPKTISVIPTPIIKEDLIFYSVGYGTGGALIRQVAATNGKVEFKEIYGLKKELGNKHGGVVLIGDHVYGDSEDKGEPYCAELMTGAIKWNAPRTGNKGSAVVIGANDRIYIHHTDGRMILAEANPKEYKEVSKFTVPKPDDRPSWSHPVILDGKLYVREQDKIMCYDIRG